MKQMQTTTKNTVKDKEDITAGATVLVDRDQACPEGSKFAGYAVDGRKICEYY